MPVWFSVEVLDGASSASIWSEAYGDALVESAILSGAVEWSWHKHTWGVVLELGFADEEAWDRFRDMASVRAALDAVPDPVTGLMVYRGRGGSAGSWEPRTHRPLSGSGSAALPLPWGLWQDQLFATSGPADRRGLAFSGGR